MKIAILTLPLHTNYGGILQAYALQTVLERMGHEVEHLQPEVTYPPLHPAWQMPLVWGKRLIRKYLGGDSKLPIFENPYKWIRKYTDKFIENNIHCRYLEEKEWGIGLAGDYDIFVVGSDQVWRPLFAMNLGQFFLNFLDSAETRRISYSASFGVDNDEYSDEERAMARSLMPMFKAVSVREESGIKLCKDIFGIDAVCTLDPTMLLTSEDYDNLSVEAPLSSGNLMTYILDESQRTDEIIDNVAEVFGLTPFRVNSKVGQGDDEPKLSNRQHPPVENWLRGFRDAEYVITDSFHACVFSIIYNKPFLCIGNGFRGMARFNTLLGQFGLMDRLISVDSDHIPSSDIDWTKVNAILDEKRRKSLDFLRQALDK